MYFDSFAVLSFYYVCVFPTIDKGDFLKINFFNFDILKFVFVCFVFWPHLNSKLIIFNLFLAIFLVDRTTYNSFFFRWCQFFRRFLQQNTWSTSRNSTKYFDQNVLFHRQLLIKELIGASSRQFDNITTSITSVLFAKEQVVTLVKAYIG